MFPLTWSIWESVSASAIMCDSSTALPLTTRLRAPQHPVQAFSSSKAITDSDYQKYKTNQKGVLNQVLTTLGRKSKLLFCLFTAFLHSAFFAQNSAETEMDYPYGLKFHSSCIKPRTNIFLEYASKEFLHNGFMVWFLVLCYEWSTNLIDAPGFIELYQKLSRSLPLPSQPPSMVREHLQKALEQAPSGMEEIVTTVVEEIVTIYEATEVHPCDCSGIAQQKLSQLSRCVLREALSTNYQLPTAIGDSPLPTVLKRFLDLEF